jgi:hypothetical protein
VYGGPKIVFPIHRHTDLLVKRKTYVCHIRKARRRKIAPRPLLHDVDDRAAGVIDKRQDLTFAETRFPPPRLAIEGLEATAEAFVCRPRASTG